MSEWVALTTPERTDWTGDVMAYQHSGKGHHIATMRIGAVGVVQDAYYDDGVLLTTEELCAIPLVAALLEACEAAAFVLHQLKETEPLFEKSWNVNQALAAVDAALAEARGKER